MGSNMLNKLISLLMCFFLLTGTAYAETSTSTGTFTILKQGQVAPFEGVLFDPTATAVILADKEQTSQEFKLKLQYELDKQKTNSDLDLKNLQISLNMNKTVNEEIIKSKDKEIKELREIAVSNSDWTWLYIGGGVVGGIAITLLTLFVSKKVD